MPIQNKLLKMHIVFSRNGSGAADASPHRCPWAHIVRVQVLARESHGAFFLSRQLLLRCKWSKKGTAGQPSPGGQGWRNRFLDPLFETSYKFNPVFVSRYSTVNETFSLSTFLRYHTAPRLNSNTSRAFCTANLRRWGIT